MDRRLIALTSVLAALLTAPPALAAHHSRSHRRHHHHVNTTRYYLALGDSLSQGMQPDRFGHTVNTNEGYANQLYALEHPSFAKLKLIKLGCGGESTISMITGHGNDANAVKLHCDRNGGSQLTAAERFLRAHHHKGEIPLITIDIAANDIDGCPKAPNIGDCINAAEASIKRNLPTILARLKAAAPKGTTIAGMTLYDPVLSGALSSSQGARELAAFSVPILQTINGELTAADQAAGIPTADVAGAFSTTDGTDMVPYNGEMIPLNVAKVCSWTWACSPPPSGPNIHANMIGYGVIATAFQQAIGTLR